MRTDSVDDAEVGGDLPELVYPKHAGINPNEKTDKYVGAIRACRPISTENKGSEAFPLEDRYKGLFTRTALLELTDGKTINTYWKVVLNRFATSPEDEAYKPSVRARQFSEACRNAGVTDWAEELAGRSIEIECFGKVKGHKGKGQAPLDVRFTIGEPGSGLELVEAVQPLFDAEMRKLNPGVDFDELEKAREERAAAKEAAPDNEAPRLGKSPLDVDDEDEPF